MGAIVAYFKDAGVEACATSPSAVRLNDVVVEVPEAVLKGTANARSGWIDAITAAHLQAELQARVESELAPGALGLELEPRPRAQAGPRVGGPRTAANRTRSRTTDGPRVFMPAATLAPIGHTARIMASYVAAHRRRLRPPSTASSQAEAAARAVGIRLRPHETWVTGHFRGIAPEGELRFRWTAPAKARGLLR